MVAKQDLKRKSQILGPGIESVMDGMESTKKVN